MNNNTFGVNPDADVPAAIYTRGQIGVNASSSIGEQRVPNSLFR